MYTWAYTTRGFCEHDRQHHGFVWGVLPAYSGAIMPPEAWKADLKIPVVVHQQV